MGQYYTPIVIRINSVKEYDSHDYDEGLKLMAHAYQKNHFVNVVVNELIDNPAHLAWVGDYADVEDYKDKSCEGLAEKFIELEKANCKYITNGDTSYNEAEYFINHTKKEYFILSKTKIKPDDFNYKIHPLPLLTAMGNGYGGGDYYGSCQELVGSWATDLIEVRYSFDKANTYRDISDDIAFEERN